MVVMVVVHSERRLALTTWQAPKRIRDLAVWYPGSIFLASSTAVCLGLK